MIRAIFFLLILCFTIQNPSFALFKKKPVILPEKMVQTKEEWMQKAQNINLEDRKIPAYQRPQDKDFKPKTAPSKKFIKYNISSGGREVDLSKIKRQLDIRSQGVFDPDFKYMAYGQYYYSPVYNQVSSDIFVQNLKGGFTRMQKALSANILDVKRTPAISAGTAQFKKDLFSTLTIVDFSKDSLKLLVKEKTGSNVNGIFRTYVWVYFLPADKNEGYSTRYDDLNETIKTYWAQKEGLALDNYRWDIKPLGFSVKNPQEVFVESYAYNIEKEPVFLGLWSIDTNTRLINLVSTKQIPVQISINGLIVKEYIP